MTTSACAKQPTAARALVTSTIPHNHPHLNHQNHHIHHLMPPARSRSRPLVGNFEENILNNRLQPDRVVEDYSLEVRSAPYNRSLRSKVCVSFFSAGDSFPYLGQAHIGQRAFKIPKKGTLQVTLFNPNGTLVKLFLLQYDLTDMPPNSQTFLRQRTLFLVRPCNSTIQSKPEPSELTTGQPTINGTSQVLRYSSSKQLFRNLPPSNLTALAPATGVQSAAITTTTAAATMTIAKRRIKYMIQLNIVSSKSNRIYLNKDLRIFISKKVDLETATQFAKQDYELRSFDEMPSNPRYFSR